MNQLQDNVAIVTGAARGIGEATAKRFIEEGAFVLLTDILEDQGMDTAARLGKNARFLKHDVSSADQWKTAVEYCISEFGKIDILVNNAGFGGVNFELMETLDVDIARKTLDINVIGTLLGMQAVVPHMKNNGSGVIINTSSTTSLRVMNSLAIYGASKWAITGLSKASALELGPFNIRVNTIHPGGANTPMGNVAQVSLDEYSKAFAHSPLQRACDPSEVANGMLFLASNQSAYCTGTELVIDGGQSAGLYMSALPGAPS